MKKICKYCGEEKELNLFVNQKKEGIIKYRNQCKECKNAARRTGKPNTGKFQKGHKFGKRFEKGNIPWYKQRGLNHPSKGTGKSLEKNSAKTKEWTKKVKERDGWKCVKCGSSNRLAAHHIIPWKEDETKRFDIDNGISLCCSCHAKKEGFQKGHVTILSPEARAKVSQANKGRKFSEETRKKMSEAKKGKPGSMTGKKMSEASKLKMSKAKLGKPCNNGFIKNHIPWNKGMVFTIKE